MKLRWYKYVCSSWVWNSKFDCWELSSSIIKDKTLQFYNTESSQWEDIDFITDEVGPGPKPKD